MSEERPLVSKAFQTVMAEAPQEARAWGTLVQSLGQASALDAKTRALAYLAVLAALERSSGIPFHVQAAKSLLRMKWNDWRNGSIEHSLQIREM